MLTDYFTRVLDVAQTQKNKNKKIKTNSRSLLHTPARLAGIVISLGQY